ncbi:IS5 family transposase [Curvibacter sp. CHRR-16]|uniref:IS5 family transposase n=1 Tax=Curvibacter sp. CHRR-16 TaxID=2835872 RepID=UPI001BDAD112|nr:IS5 family transposase [Curvibacter sp. CHRR-16]MBT0569004.1 IS5 family transposase [Curvibacter sp. CHRR-16]
MKQMSLAHTGFELVTKRTRKREFLEEINLVIPWTELLALIAPHVPEGKTGRPPFPTQVMLRIHLLQQFFGHSDPTMEEALHDIPLYREFAHLDAGISRLPDESTILRFRHLLQEHGLGQQILASVNAKLIDRGLMLKTGTVVDATLIAAPSSTKNDSGERDPEMHQTKKGNQWHFGMKAHIGVDADSGLVHTVPTTAANAHNITQAHALLHGEEEVVFADSGYRGVHKREEIQDQHPEVDWLIAMTPSERKVMDKSKLVNALREQLEKLKASIRAKVEHPFRVIKCQFGYRKVRYRGLAKNTNQLLVMFAMSNLWMARKRMVQGLQA